MVIEINVIEIKYDDDDDDTHYLVKYKLSKFVPTATADHAKPEENVAMVWYCAKKTNHKFIIQYDH